MRLSAGPVCLWPLGVNEDVRMKRYSDRGTPGADASARRTFLVGTPIVRLNKLEQGLARRPWQAAHPEVRVKILRQQHAP